MQRIYMLMLVLKGLTRQNLSLPPISPPPPLGPPPCNSNQIPTYPGKSTSKSSGHHRKHCNVKYENEIILAIMVNSETKCLRITYNKLQ